jgi:urease accessory protein
MMTETLNHPSVWEASLNLGFENRDDRTVLVRSFHRGPLRIQKALYPEGPEVCHAVLLHPPGGIAGGDSLRIDVETGKDTHTLITTPGAAKWYRSGGRRAFQNVSVTVEDGASLEYMPQETIFFDGADAEIGLDVRLGLGSSYLGLDTFCLGRVAAGEAFRRGRVAMHTRIFMDGLLAWSDRARIDGGGSILDAPPGLAGYPYCATVLAAGPGMSRAVLDACREFKDEPDVRSGLTLLPCGVIAGRCLGLDAEPVKRWFLNAWSVLRPALTGKQAVIPRLWNT